MKDTRAVIALGSNIRPVINMAIAMKHLKTCFEIVSASSIQTTRPIGIIDQPDFLNCVVMINTSLSQTRIIDYLKQIEDKMGRDRTAPKSGPRVIDLDLLIWDGQVVNDDYFSKDFLRNAVAELNE